MSLTEKAVGAAKWSAIFSVLQQIVSLSSSVIMYRLLSPEDYGLNGVVIAYVSVVNMIENLGFPVALIQRKELSEKTLNTAFWSMLFTGFVLLLMMGLASPLIASFYNDERLISLIAVSSLSIVLGVLMAIQLSILKRDLNLKLLKQIDFAATILSTVISIFFAVRGFGVWALVAGVLSYLFFNMVLLWLKIKWRPKLLFSFSEFKLLFHYGKYVTAAKVLGQSKFMLPQAIIGKLLGTIPLGYYNFANRLTSLPNMQVRGAIAQILLPVFSQVQDDNKRLQRGYLKIVYYISLFTFPVMAIIYMASPEMVNIIFGEKWLPAVPLLQLLCVLGLVDEIFNIVSSIFHAKNRPDIVFKWNLLTLVVHTATIIAFVRFGIVNVVMAIVGVSLILFVLYEWTLNHLIELTWRDFIRNLYNPFIATTIMLITVLSIRGLLFRADVGATLVLIIEVVVSVLAYGISIFYLDRIESYNLWKMIRGGSQKSHIILN